LDEEQQALNVRAATGRSAIIPAVWILFFISRISFCIFTEHPVQHIFPPERFFSASLSTNP
jgi:hypothetical protein